MTNLHTVYLNNPYSRLWAILRSPAGFSIFTVLVFGGEASVGRECVEAVGPLCRYVFG